MALPQLPVPLEGVIPYLASAKSTMQEAMQPYRDYEFTLREIYAQDRQNPILDKPNVNLVPIFDGHENELRIRARDLAAETSEVKDKYVLQLTDDDRHAHGVPAITPSLGDFKKNFNVFSESSLVDMNWSNVVVAGSAAVTALLPTPDKYKLSKRALREYYHKKLAPASDVDLFLYGLNEAEAKKKILEIETRIRDSILYETTTIRTKYAITIASQHPCRHVQIVLRLYKNLSEILAGFDVDSSCVAFDGNQVYATPRAIAAFMTQTNVTDLSRRSPSYENRLSKYSHRGFEVYCPTLDRSRIDPTIFERSFGRVLGLARLLVLEKLPLPTDRDVYISERRAERGRPALPWNGARHGLAGNIKEDQLDDVAEWVTEDEASNYHTFTVPYGPAFHAKKIEKLLFTKDLLLNAEWNKSKDRNVHLHRHPAFFGKASDVFGDCCGACPEPTDEETVLVAEQEAEIYIQGPIEFIVDHPGRQQIGSFNPLTEDDWTEMAFVGNTTRLCQAIADGDSDHVRDWCDQEDSDVNRRDHTGRTPLHLATQCSTPGIVQCLIDHGARITRRLNDGKTALHIAAQRGDVDMVKALIAKSEQKEAEEDERQDRRLKRVRQQQNATMKQAESESTSPEEELVENSDDDKAGHSDDEMTQGSYVRVKPDQKDDSIAADDDNEEPDFYDPNVLAWDYGTSPLHLAIIAGHVEVVRILVDSFGADILLPVKIKDQYSRDPEAAIMTLVLAAQFAPNPSEMTREVLQRGASSSQADMDEVSALHYIVQDGSQTVLNLLLEYDGPAARAAINHVAVSGWFHQWHTRTPLLTAIDQCNAVMVKILLENGASATVSYDSFASAYLRRTQSRSMNSNYQDPEQINNFYEASVMQPIIRAVLSDQPEVARMLIDYGADANTLTADALLLLIDDKVPIFRQVDFSNVKSLLDLVRNRKQALEEAQRKLLGEKHNDETIPEVEELKSDDKYLEALKPKSYQYWTARIQLDRAKEVVESMKQQRNKALDRTSQGPEDPTHEKRKSEIKRALDEFDKLEKSILRAGAQTWEQLHPDRKVDVASNQQGGQPQQRPKRQGPWTTKFNFMVPALSESACRGYTALFESAWIGDIEQIKALTLAEWTQETIGKVADDQRTDHPQSSISAEQEGSKSANPPLCVGVQDSQHFTPFSIAVLRGHLELADVILDIAMFQYHPTGDRPKYQYSLQPIDPYGYSDSVVSQGSELAPDTVTVYKHLVNPKYTIESVAALHHQVESTTTPMMMLTSACEVQRLMHPRDAKYLSVGDHPNPFTALATNYGANFDKYTQGHLLAVLEYPSNRAISTLREFAIAKNDLALFRWLLDREDKYARREEFRDPARVPWREDRTGQLWHCMSLGRIEIIAEIIRRTGIRLPIQRMVEKSGVEVQEKSLYYQGLTVYGRKRKDWADRSRGIVAHQDRALDTPPLLDAAFRGTIETIEYFLSDAPLRRYEEYVATKPDDASFEALRKERGGISKATSTWLAARNQLSLHAAVLAEPRRDQSNQRLHLLINAMPHAIDGLNCTRLTPLLLAFRHRRLAAARILISAGANQATRDRSGHNVLHQLVSDMGRYHQITEFRAIIFEAFVALLDPTLPHDLLLERSAPDEGSHTPLSWVLHFDSRQEQPELLQKLLYYSKGAELELMDGAGDYPLHHVVRQGMGWAAKVLIDHNPALLHRENAVGLTPLEICEIASLSLRIQSPPSMQDYHQPQQRSLLVSGEQQRPRGGDDARRDDLAATKRLCIDGMTAHPGPRKLVSLPDANEVAKRLAEGQGRKRQPLEYTSRSRKYDWNQRGSDDARDEVDAWKAHAFDSQPWDVLSYLIEQGYDVRLNGDKE